MVEEPIVRNRHQRSCNRKRYSVELWRNTRLMITGRKYRIEMHKNNQIIHCSIVLLLYQSLLQHLLPLSPMYTTGIQCTMKTWMKLELKEEAPALLVWIPMMTSNVTPTYLNRTWSKPCHLEERNAWRKLMYAIAKESHARYLY